MVVPENDAHPERIGPYRILDLLGEGGMAVVYLAEQSEPVQRKVALKILKAGMDSKQVVARFESERQALAVLDYPHIAKVFDGGIAENGRPYFVMQYVDGVPINEYCDAQRATIATRIRLFVDVCRAVQHAHLKGLIHRDVKPSNILVTEVDGEPQPKVIDFGVAKVLETPVADTKIETRIGQVVGTPQYMSPEQMGSGDIDSRADVYSLGVVLYELLSGSLPLDLTAVRDIALPAVIRERIPPSPSARFADLDSKRNDIAAARRISPQELDRTLQGDLDLIVMKAIEKDRSLRYDTASALAADCGRFLNHDAVLARPPSVGYQLGRFVRRNRALVAVAAMALLALVGGSIAATVGYLRATAAEQKAIQEAETATRVSEFLVELFEVSDPSAARGNSVTAREILDAAVGRIDETLADEPGVRANLKYAMAQVYANLGILQEAELLARDAPDIRRADSTNRELLADSLDQLGSISTQLGKSDAAMALHEEALEARQHGRNTATAGQVATLQHLATAAYMQSNIEQSRDYFLRALEMTRAMPNPDKAVQTQITGDLGVIFDRLGDFETAEVYKRNAVEAFDELYGPVHPQSATARNNLALTLNRLRKPNEAAELYQEALEAYRTLYVEQHPNTANTLNNLAQVLLRLERFDEAEQMQRESYAMFESIFGPGHTQVGTAGVNLGRILLASEKPSEAEASLRKALEIQETALSADHQRIFVAREALAAALIRQGKFAEGRQLAESAVDHFSGRYGDEHWRTARSSSVLADALIGTGEYEAAERLLLEALPRIEESLGEDHPASLATAESLATLYERSGNPEKAMQQRPIRP